MLYKIEDGTLMAGGHMLLAHFNLEIKTSEHIALVGENGAGKTTLLKLIAGETDLERDDKRHGSGIIMSEQITTGMLRQNPFEGIDTEHVTVIEYREMVCPNQTDTRFAKIFTSMGFEMSDMDRKLSEFSGGQQTKIALIPLMLKKPDILLLDEPTNHLDIESTEKLEEYIRKYPGAVVCVSHDRFFLDETADSVIELEDGRLKRYAGDYSTYRSQKIKETAAAVRAYQRQQEEIKREEDLIKRFKGRPRKAAFARSRKKILDRMKLIEKPRQEAAHIFTGDIDPEIIGPKRVLEAQKLEIGYDLPLMEISLRIRRGQKIGIIGPNGAGKTTFVRTVAGIIHSLGGRLRTGEGVTAEYFDQHTAEKLEEVKDKSVLEYFMQAFPSMTVRDARKYLASYLFRGRDTAKTPAMLSGGERARLALAVILGRRPNLLILDEPTNHMDIPARETLESAFMAYRGTILFISHDRYFISQVADSLLILEKDPGRAYYYPFGYRHYTERKKALSAQTGGHDKGISDISAKVLAEDEALISSLHNVPKGSHIQSRRMSTERANLDWRLGLAREALEDADNEVKRLNGRLEDLEAQQLISFAEEESDEGKGERNLEGEISEVSQALEAARKRYYDLELEWYDLWQDTGFEESE